MKSPRRFAVLFAVGLAACDANIGPSTPAPVVQVILVAGDSLQIASVEWMARADSPIYFNRRPIYSTLVQLSLVLPGGGSVAFTPVHEPPGGGFVGRYGAATPVAYRATYRLQGTVAGHVVSGTTTTPDSLRIMAPAQDTVRISYAACSYNCSLPFHWVAAGAVQYQYLSAKAGAFIGYGGGYNADTVGNAYVQPSHLGADTTELVVHALEEQAAAFLHSGSPKGNLTGVFGLFGAASVGRRVVIWE